MQTQYAKQMQSTCHALAQNSNAKAYCACYYLQGLGSVQGDSRAQTLSVSQKDQEIDNQSSWAINHSSSINAVHYSYLSFHNLGFENQIR